MIAQEVRSARGPIPRAPEAVVDAETDECRAVNESVRNGAKAISARKELRAELLGFTLLLVLLNFPLLAGRSTGALAFQTDAVAAGQWWRLFTHPFVHVSWYHLLLDGSAFLSLYAFLLTGQRWRRLAYVAATAAGSLIVALCASPLIANYGLCGLSGVAHGLMAVSAMEMLTLPRGGLQTRTIALASLVGVTAKCLFELVTDHALFATFHFGLLGTPIVACHAGGVLGGLVGLLILRRGEAHPRLNKPA